VASNFNAVFLAGTTNFNRAGVISTLNTSAILAAGTFRANSTVQFTSTGSLPAGITLPATTATNVALYNMGTLGGRGKVVLRSSSGGLGTMVNTGTIAPGNSIDTLTIDGNVSNTGALEIEINPTAASGSTNDLLVVNSGVAGQTATFTFSAGSTVNFLTSGTTVVPGTVYDFLTAGSNGAISITGTPVSAYELVNATDNLANYKYYVLGNSSSLTSLSNLYAVVARDHAYELYATSESQTVLGKYLDAHRTDTRFDPVLYSLSVIASNDDFNMAIERMSGEFYPSLLALEQERSSALVQGLATTLRPVSNARSDAEKETFEPRWYTFAQGAGSSLTASDDKVADIDSTYYGLLAGVGCQIYPKTDIGAFINVGNGDADNKHPDKADFSNVDFGVYGRYNNAGDYYYASFSYGNGKYDVTRQAAVARASTLFPQAAVVTDGSFNAKQLTAYVEKGYTFAFGRSTVQPYAAFQYAQTTGDSFTEKNGGTMNLTAKFGDLTSERALLGASWKYEISSMFAAGLRASWAHEFGDDSAYIDASLLGAGDTYRLHGVELGSDRFNAGADLTVRFTEKLNAFLRLDYTTSDGLKVKSGNVGVRYAW
jgi:fibronectin-binding autotransporter adhesin